MPWPVNLLFFQENRFPFAGNDCVARCCLLFFVGKGYGDDREQMWWLRIMFPSSVKGEITPQSLPRLEFKDKQCRVINICVPQTVTSDQVNPGSYFPVPGYLRLIVSAGSAVGEEGKAVSRVLRPSCLGHGQWLYVSVVS